MNSIEQEWVNGDVSLGSAANWSADEIRLVSELGYALAEQGRHQEAIAVFEGLAAVAPATHYFDSALGALWLRETDFEKALDHLDSALQNDPGNIANRVNRAEALIHLGRTKAAVDDLLELSSITSTDPLYEKSLTRAKALLATLSSSN